MLDLRPIRSAFKYEGVHFLADPQWVLPSLVAPLAFAVITLMMMKGSDGPVVLYAVLGGGILGMWGNTLFKSGFSVNFDRMNGTLEPLMMTPTPLTHVIAGRTIFNCLLGLLNALVVFVVAELVMGASMSIEDPVMFFLALMLTLLSLSSIGILFSGAFVFTRASMTVMQVMEFPLYIISGALLPIVALPEFLYPFSFILGPAWGVEALKASAGVGSGMPFELGFTFDIVLLLVCTCAYLLMARYIFIKLEWKARTVGSLGRW
jgi:ABC-2 type transport system permease protein